MFCEVKARTSDAFGVPAEAVTPAKQARIRRLAARWLASTGAGRGAPADPLRRGVGPGGPLEILEAAF